MYRTKFCPGKLLILMTILSLLSFILKKEQHVLNPTSNSSTKRTEQEMFERENPYFPYEAFKMKRFVRNCNHFPTFHTISFDNSYWQVANLKSTTIYIFSAHFDNRTYPTIRVLAETVGRINQLTTKCYLWFSINRAPVITDIKLTYLYGKPSFYTKKHSLYTFPVVISCLIPKRDNIPISISIAESNCSRISNNIKIYSANSNEKSGVSVCLKGLQYNSDMSKQLTEWIEINKELGIAKMTFYIYNIHPKTKQLLEKYTESGSIDMLPITIPGRVPNTYFMRKELFDATVRAWVHEIVPINDCYFRNMNIYQYVLVIDIDELIVPKKHRTLTEMINSISNSFTSLSFSEVYFWSNNTKCIEGTSCDLYYFQRTLRSPKYFLDTRASGHYKSLHNTDKVVWVGHHYEGGCVSKCERRYVSTDIAHNQHYRETCELEIQSECNNKYRNGSYDERLLWRYMDSVIIKVAKMLEYL
ncbi:uncharacterized protein LOC136034378 [Artemia franciscana]|uniref:Glycosyltransferase family 92 protein n=1 Tax=Artemia franciscana TaxID=6661 RepID=A0AA88I736_ARTSF|nr:hypothetical protein QYM36_003306 [Artemia franciscana]